MNELGRNLMLLGVVLVAVGAWISWGPRLNLPLGRLPLDIHIERPNFSFHFPLGTCLLLSAVLSLVAWLLRR